MTLSSSCNSRSRISFSNSELRDRKRLRRGRLGILDRSGRVRFARASSNGCPLRRPHEQVGLVAGEIGTDSHLWLQRACYLETLPLERVLRKVTMSSSSPLFRPRFPISVALMLTATSSVGQLATSRGLLKCAHGAPVRLTVERALGVLWHAQVKVGEVGEERPPHGSPHTGPCPGTATGPGVPGRSVAPGPSASSRTWR